MTVSESLDSSITEIEGRRAEENSNNGEEEEENSEARNVIPMVLERSRRDNAGTKLKRLLEEEIEVGDEFYEQEYVSRRGRR